MPERGNKHDRNENMRIFDEKYDTDFI